MKTKTTYPHQSDGDVMPPFFSLHDFKLNKETYIQRPEKV